MFFSSIYFITSSLQSIGFFIHWFDSKNLNHPALTFFFHLNQVPINIFFMIAFISCLCGCCDIFPISDIILRMFSSVDWSDDSSCICLKKEEQGTTCTTCKFCPFLVYLIYRFSVFNRFAMSAISAPSYAYLVVPDINMI